MEQNISEIISVSEIGKFDYCPFGWYIEKKGLIDEIKDKDRNYNEAIQRGIEEHKKFVIEVEKYREHSVIRVILFIVLILIFLYVSLTLLVSA